jgi:hypothetical protein
MPSTYPAIALSAQASARLRRDLRIMRPVAVTGYSFHENGPV